MDARRDRQVLAGQPHQHHPHRVGRCEPLRGAPRRRRHRNVLAALCSAGVQFKSNAAASAPALAAIALKKRKQPASPSLPSGWTRFGDKIRLDASDCKIVAGDKKTNAHLAEATRRVVQLAVGRRSSAWRRPQAPCERRAQAGHSSREPQSAGFYAGLPPLSEHLVLAAT